jgi:hypothetical protein
MVVRSQVVTPVGRLLSGARGVLEGGAHAARSVDEVVRRLDIENLVALRLCASDVLAAFAVSAYNPGALLLRAIVRALVAVPKLPSWVRNASSLDRATLVMLKWNGISGFTYVQNGGERAAPPREPVPLIEWAAARRSLAVPRLVSAEHRALAERRVELLEAVVLA